MTGPDIVRLASTLGEPARAAIVGALMDGRALTAKELAYLARIGAPTASAHLARLVEAGMLDVVKQGRHRYFRISGPEAASAIEAVMGASPPSRPIHHGQHAALSDIRFARTCYDHLAGRLGVALADRMDEMGLLAWSRERADLTGRGRDFAQALGIAPTTPGRSRRPFARACLDWSERRSHLAGAFGAAIAERFIECGWIRRLRDSRAIVVTETGRLRIRETFGLDVEMLRGETAAPVRAALPFAGSVLPDTGQAEDFPDDAAPEEQHADHEDRADHHRHG
jgi:DNA-binding transcriptional ArsR family regulator